MKDIMHNLASMDVQFDGRDMVVSDVPECLGWAAWCATQTNRGTWSWDLDYGVDWPGILSGARGGNVAALLTAAIREAIRPIAHATVRDVRVDTGNRSALVTVDVAGQRLLVGGSE